MTAIPKGSSRLVNRETTTVQHEADRDSAEHDPPDARQDGKKGGGKPANSAPDAVKDPNEKTDGKPGIPAQGDETDPGAG